MATPEYEENLFGNQRLICLDCINGISWMKYQLNLQGTALSTYETDP